MQTFGIIAANFVSNFSRIYQQPGVMFNHKTNSRSITVNKIVATKALHLIAVYIRSNDVAQPEAYIHRHPEANTQTRQDILFPA